MITRDTIRSLSITLDNSLFSQMVANSGSKPNGEHPFLDSILKLLHHGTPIFIQEADGPNVAQLEIRPDGMLMVRPVPSPTAA